MEIVSFCKFSSFNHVATYLWYGQHMTVNENTVFKKNIKTMEKNLPCAFGILCEANLGGSVSLWRTKIRKHVNSRPTEIMLDHYIRPSLNTHCV